MNPGPLEIIGNPLTPDWVKQALKAAVQQDTLDGIYWANVILMALRREANEKALDAAAVPPRKRDEIVCPASEEGGKRTNCHSCQLCNGAGKARNVSIVAHGRMKEHFV